jgi:hypothetical protein
MDDEHSFRDAPDDLHRESQRVELARACGQINQPQVTCWITDRMCKCGSPIITDGKREWCANKCTKMEEEYRPMGFINDLIR